MKNNLTRTVLILLSILMLTSCNISINGGSSYYGETLRVMGTAKRNPETKEYDFVSADIIVDGYKNITKELKPVNSKLLVNDVEENVLFEAPVNAILSIDVEAKAKEGYEFDSWKVTPLSELINDDTNYYDRRKIIETINDIHNYLNEEIEIKDKDSKTIKVRRRYLPSLKEISEDFLPFITAEYDPKTIYVSLVEGNSGDGSRDNAYSIDKFLAKCKYANELNLIVKFTEGLNSSNVSKLLYELFSFPNLEELKLTADQKVRPQVEISAFDKLDDVHFSGITSTGAILNQSNTKWTFSNCTIENLTVNTDKSVLIEDSTYNKITPGKDKETEVIYSNRKN